MTTWASGSILDPAGRMPSEARPTPSAESPADRWRDPEAVREHFGRAHVSVERRSLAQSISEKAPPDAAADRRPRGFRRHEQRRRARRGDALLLVVLARKAS